MWAWVCPCTVGVTRSQMRCLLRRRRLLLAQFVAREFADRGARQFVDEFERGGNFVLAEFSREKGLQLIQRERLRTIAQFDKSLGRLAAIGVGNADHDHGFRR